MDRCAAAYAYHKQGYNCAQSVAGAFADLTGTAPEQLMAAMGGFGGGVGGSHEELCGAVSGGVLVLICTPYGRRGQGRKGAPLRPGQGVPPPVPGGVRPDPVRRPAAGPTRRLRGTGLSGWSHRPATT